MSSRTTDTLDPLYLMLNEECDGLLLPAVNHCISLLQSTEAQRPIENRMRLKIQELGGIIDQLLAEIQNNNIRNRITCLYCGEQCSRALWRRHFLNKCRQEIYLRSALPMSSIYEIDDLGLMCRLCHKACASINDKIAHDDTIGHYLMALNSTDNINCESIYCSLCRETLPNNNIRCYHHFIGNQHWFMQQYGRKNAIDKPIHGISDSVIRCGTCNAKLRRVRITNPLIGLVCKVKIPNYDYFIHCAATSGTSDCASHSYELCSKSTLNYYCQLCLATICGYAELYDHVLQCDLQKKILNDDLYSVEFSKALSGNIQCFYCAKKFLIENLRHHIKVSDCNGLLDNRKNFNPIDKSRSDEFSHLLIPAVLCNLCKVFNCTFKDMEGHSSSTMHLSSIRAFTNNLDVIYCQTCQEDIPNNLYHCYGHIKSKKHQLFCNDQLDWRMLSIKYLAFIDSILCVSCNCRILLVNLQFVDNHRCSDSSFGILKNEKGGRVWCSQCEFICNISNIKNHLFQTCKKTIQNYYCQNCYETIEGRCEFEKHLFQCCKNDTQNFFLESKKITFGKNLPLSENDNELIERVSCYGCGEEVRNLLEHIGLQCETPYNKIRKPAGMSSIYKMSAKLIECRACMGVKLTIEEKKIHDKLDTHLRFVAKNELIDVSTIFCVICDVFLPNDNNCNYLNAHHDSDRHIKLVKLPNWASKANVGYVILHDRVKCLTCIRSFKGKKLCFHPNRQKKIWCSLCDTILEEKDRADHRLLCNQSLIDNYCQLCHQVKYFCQNCSNRDSRLPLASNNEASSTGSLTNDVSFRYTNWIAIAILIVGTIFIYVR